MRPFLEQWWTYWIEKGLYFTYMKSFRTEIKLIFPKYITRTYFDIKLSIFGLAGVPMIAIFNFWKSISELFEEIQY